MARAFLHILSGRMLKHCPYCDITKAVEEFWKSNRTKDGYDYRCSRCSKYTRSFKKRRDWERAYSRRKYRENKEHIKWQRKLYRIKYSIDLLRRERYGSDFAFRKRCIEIVMKYAHSRHGRARCMARYNAKKLHISLDGLTREILKHPIYITLYNEWKKSNYKVSLTPCLWLSKQGEYSIITKSESINRRKSSKKRNMHL